MKKVLQGASLLAISLAVGTPALAQDQGQFDPAEPVTQAVEGNAIVVTANRREQSIQDSSLIISALGADELSRKGISDPAAIGRTLPGIEIGSAGGALQAFVRGVGNPGSTAVTNPAVPINVDGVYIARSQATAGNFFDLDRIEVLKGPQGTLYGRNASGGAINLIPARPRLGETSGYISGEVGNYDLFGAEAAINFPLWDTFAIRASGQVVSRDGYLSDGTDDDKHESVRLQALWEASPDFSVSLWTSYTSIHGRGGGFSYVGAPDPWDSIFPGGTDILLAGAANLGLIAPQPALPPGITGPIAGPAPSPPFPPGSNLLFLVDPIQDTNYADMEFWNFHATFEADLGFATLTFIPAYQKSNLKYKAQPGISFEVRGIFDDSPETSEATSLELRLAGDSGRVNWVAGLYYFDEAQVVRNRINNGLAQNFTVNADMDTESFGIFADVTIDASDTFRLLGGVRYSDDEIVKSNFERFAVFPALDPVPCHLGNAQDFNGTLACQFTFAGAEERVTFDDVSWKAGFEYDLSLDSMLFATAATGYKSGGLSLADGSAFDPETLTAFTLGLRNTLLGGDLILNAELFYWLYDDHQEFLIGPDASGAVGQMIINAGKAEAIGGSIEAAYRLSPNDNLSLGIEYNDANYKTFSFEQSARFTNTSTACDLTPTGEVVGGFPVLLTDCSALQLARAPKWSGTAAYAHTFDLPNGGYITGGVDAKFASSRWVSVEFLPGQRADAYQVVNANLSYTSPDESLTLTAYVRNIFEEAVYTNSTAHTIVGDLIGIAVAAPRTYGIKAKLAF